MSPKLKPLIVIIKEDRSLASELEQKLEVAGFLAQVFHKGATALKFIGEHYVHGIVASAALPDMSALNLIEQVRKISTSPAIILLSPNKDVAEIVAALNAGADDFILKPYMADELIARINAVLRRSEISEDSRLTRNADLMTGSFKFNGAEVCPDRLELVFSPTKRCKLGRKELGILYHLHANPGVIISRNSLIHAVWGVHANVRSRSLDQYVAKIRDAFDIYGNPLNCLRTIHGIGFWYENEDKKDDVIAAKKVRRS